MDFQNEPKMSPSAPNWAVRDRFAGEGGEGEEKR